MAELPEGTRIGRVALDVGDLEGAVALYGDVVGLEKMAGADGRATMAAGETPLLELRAAGSRGARPPDAAGLFHAAYRVPGRADLAAALGRIRDGWELTGASDHLVSEALYLRDREDNGVEVYRDRPREQWDETPEGVQIDTLPLNLEDLAAAGGGEAGGGSGPVDGSAVPPGTDVGHVHLEVTDLGRARAFYVDALGFDEMARMDGASFVAAGGYHHHVGLNTWGGRSAPAAGRGLAWFEVVLPDRAAVSAAAGRLRDGGYDVEAIDGDAAAGTTGGGYAVEDPDGIELRLVAEE